MCGLQVIGRDFAIVARVATYSLQMSSGYITTACTVPPVGGAVCGYLLAGREQPNVIAQYPVFAMKWITVILCLAVAGFCLFGILACSEPGVPHATAFAIGYGIIGIACLVVASGTFVATKNLTMRTMTKVATGIFWLAAALICVSAFFATFGPGGPNSIAVRIGCVIVGIGSLVGAFRSFIASMKH